MSKLGISSLSEKMTEYRNKWKAHMQRMEHIRILLQAHKYQPSRKRDVGRPRRRWRETTILEAGTGDSPNPRSDDDDVCLKYTSCPKECVNKQALFVAAVNIENCQVGICSAQRFSALRDETQS
jgi:hypothetical protein